MIHESLCCIQYCIACPSCIYDLLGTKIWIIGHRSNLLYMSRRPISENVEVNKTDRYTEPSYIKMLPDVGIVKEYPMCVLKGSKCWPGCYTVTEHLLFPGLFWPVCFFMLLPVASETPSTIPTSLLVLWDTLLLLLFLYFLWSASCMTTCEHVFQHVHTSLH